MSNQEQSRKINLNNAHTGGQNGQGQQSRRPLYDQAADAQRAQAAAQPQRRPQAPAQRNTAYDQYAAQRYAQQQSRAAQDPYAQQRAAQQYAQQRSPAQAAQYRSAQTPPQGYSPEQWQAMQAAQAQRAAQQRAQAQLAAEQRMRAQQAQRAPSQARAPQAGQSGAQSPYAQQRAMQQGAAGYGQQRQMQQSQINVTRAPQGTAGMPNARAVNAQAGAAQRSMPQQGRPMQGARPVSGSAAQGRTAPSGARPSGVPQSRAPQNRPAGAQHAAPRRGAGAQGGGVPSGIAKQRAAAQSKKKKARQNALLAISITLSVILVCVIGLRIYLGTIVNTGEVGRVTEEIKTPPQFQGKQLSVLLIGIDYTTQDSDIVARDPIGMTDMIMYMRFNFEDNSLRMLQIPRDTFVGSDLSTGGTGKINALYKNGEDTENRINNIATVVSEQLQLPIDSYISIDMESLREIVELFGGIEVYVAQELDYGGSHLNQGWQNLMGPDVEFFLRDRHNFATGDIGRLDNQRYFYSALFRRVRTATWQDIVKLMPVVQKYINTDISITDCAGLAIKLLKMPSSNIMLCRLPTYDGSEKYNGAHSVQVVDLIDTADLLNLYYRTPETQLAADTYTAVADFPHGSTAHEPNVQWMNSIDAEGGGTVGEAADATMTGDDLIAQAEAQSASVTAAAAGSVAQ